MDIMLQKIIYNYFYKVIIFDENKQRFWNKVFYSQYMLKMLGMGEIECPWANGIFTQTVEREDTS